jgi:hypothetical protein
MFGLDWSDPQTLWLNLTNLALGLITLAAVLVVAGGVLRELVTKRQKARELDNLDGELRSMMNGSAHILAVPELGLTMADGGEPIEPSSEKPAPGKSTRR